MKVIENWNSIQEASSQNIIPEEGVYTLRIITAVDYPEREYIKLEFDIADGEFAGYYRSIFDKYNFWGISEYRSYKGKALGLFKSFIARVEENNPDFIWDFNENRLIGKTVRVVLQKKLYTKQNGTDGWSLSIYQYLKEGEEFTGEIPVIDNRNKNKPIQMMDIPAPNFESIPDSNMPF